jgi:hypothetical protein
MKKIKKPAEKEEAAYYSDFTGKALSLHGAPVDLHVSFNYGSCRDGANLRLHLDDKDIKPILDLIKLHLCSAAKKQLKKQLRVQEQKFDDAIQFRDLGACDAISNDMHLLMELLDLSDVEGYEK